MWVIQGEVMVSLPDGSPLPPGAIPVEPPAEFADDPRRFAVRDGKLVAAEPAKAVQKKPKLELTQAEIAKLKAAIKAGKL